MTEQEKKEKRNESTQRQEEKKKYEAPDVADEGSFENVVLSCPFGSFETCGGVSS